MTAFAFHVSRAATNCVEVELEIWHQTEVLPDYEGMTDVMWAAMVCIARCRSMTLSIPGCLLQIPEHSLTTLTFIALRSLTLIESGWPAWEGMADGFMRGLASSAPNLTELGIECRLRQQPCFFSMSRMPTVVLSRIQKLRLVDYCDRVPWVDLINLQSLFLAAQVSGLANIPAVLLTQLRHLVLTGVRSESCSYHDYLPKRESFEHLRSLELRDCRFDLSFIMLSTLEELAIVDSVRPIHDFIGNLPPTDPYPRCFHVSMRPRVLRLDITADPFPWTETTTLPLFSSVQELHVTVVSSPSPTLELPTWLVRILVDDAQNSPAAFPNLIALTVLLPTPTSTYLPTPLSSTTSLDGSASRARPRDPAALDDALHLVKALVRRREEVAPGMVPPLRMVKAGLYFVPPAVRLASVQDPRAWWHKEWITLTLPLVHAAGKRNPAETGIRLGKAREPSR
ncbi:hypothetical protein HKX48_005061 [Thoreauomyces humboldtii]|nr:hypothetical protein HKX48_005061 [Thoreauomyces humboldtii]